MNNALTVMKLWQNILYNMILSVYYVLVMYRPIITKVRNKACTATTQASIMDPRAAGTRAAGPTCAPHLAVGRCPAGAAPSSHVGRGVCSPPG